MPKKKKLFSNKNTYWSIFFLFIQQIIVACSTIWISNIGEGLVGGKSIALYFGMFAASLFIVYIPGIASSYNLEKAKNNAIQNYVDEFSEKYKNKPTLLSDKKITEDREPWLTNEGPKTIEETFSTAYDSIAVGLNAGLNIGAICYAIDPRLSIGYGASVLSILGISACFKGKLITKTELFQIHRKSMFQNLSFGWHNIIIGNKYNLTIWLNRFKARWNSYNNSAITTLLFREFSSSFAMAVALLPVAGNMLWLFLDNNDKGKLVALVATLPRQIQIIQNLREFCVYATTWPGTYAKYKQLIASIEELPYDKQQIQSRINLNKITFTFGMHHIKFNTIDDFIAFINKSKNGRVTIKGSNGAGKTTLLGLAKKELGDKAYLLPVKSKLLFDSTEEDSLSTGLDVIASLQEINKHFSQAEQFYQGNTTSQHVLLFDEWGASLDPENLRNMSRLLDNIASKNCVVEVRHTPDASTDIKAEVNMQRSSTTSAVIDIVEPNTLISSQNVLPYFSMRSNSNLGNSSPRSPLLGSNRTRSFSANTANL